MKERITLATLAEHTDKEIFECAVEGLRSQGFEQSMDGDGHCVYRGREGSKCAIGFLMTDGEFLRLSKWIPEHTDPDGPHPPTIVGSDVDDLNVTGLFPGIDDHVEILTALQVCHDRDGDTPEQMRNALRRLAVGKHWNDIAAALEHA